MNGDAQVTRLETSTVCLLTGGDHLVVIATGLETETCTLQTADIATRMMHRGAAAQATTVVHAELLHDRGLHLLDDDEVPISIPVTAVIVVLS